MPRYGVMTERSEAGTSRRIALDERFIVGLLPDTPLEQLEIQELRRALERGLQTLTARELRVIELRFQHKKSPGQVAAQMEIHPPQVRAAETRALNKLRRPLAAFLES